MISIALTFGAPERVPAGSTAINASRAFLSDLSFPFTSETRCITFEYLSVFIKLVTSTLPNSETLPTSLRPRSTSIVCSAHSFGSEISDFSSARSSSSVFPRGTVPAIGLVFTMPSVTFTSISGEAPAIL